MYKYVWDEETGGLLLTTELEKMSKEPRPVYFRELDILGFDKYWSYPKDGGAPFMWAEANNYIYRGRKVAKTKGGALYTAPELIILDEPEPEGKPLKFIDIELMVKKNAGILENIAQETIQGIYNTYTRYRDKVDLFYVAFSGGKDSVVTLDLVQRALPHNEFMVLFANTDMEFPTTLKLVDEYKNLCNQDKIVFLEVKSHLEAIESWEKFGPPARKLRWCCTVHKTAPIINQLCNKLKLNKLHSMMITGVRGDESVARSDYDELSLGKKLSGQYSFHPILNYSSAETYLYIFKRHLLLNDAYKWGFNRVGCIMCPNSSKKHEFIKNSVLNDEVRKFTNIIVKTSRKDLSGNNSKLFLENGGWKTRLSGRELKLSEDERFIFEEKNNSIIFNVKDLNPAWIQWYKTIGDIENNHPFYVLEYNGIYRKCILTIDNSISTFNIENERRSKNSIEFVYYFKCLLAKSQYCIKCKACAAECPNRNIEINANDIKINDNCNKCHSCLKILSGCLFYNSVKGSKDMKSVKGVNKYYTVGVRFEWIKKYIEDPSFEPGNKKTEAMFSFLNDSGLIKKRKFTKFSETIRKLNIDNETSCSLMLCNLAYSAPFRWYIENIPFNERYDNNCLMLDMEEATKKARREFWDSFKVILDSNSFLQSIGFGIPDITERININGDIKKSLVSIERRTWLNPDPRVILYSLYKFAEECGGTYQFTLTTLADDSIERDGVSPTRIFGLTKEDMQPILNGLSVNYPDFISASFSLGLDTINLNDTKSSQDVLSLF